MYKTIGNIIAVVMLATAINSAPVSFGSVETGFVTSVAEAGNRCRKHDHDCNRSTGGKTWRGTDTNPNKIQVTVCHGYWNRLDVGYYKGQRTRFWEPVVLKGAWKSGPIGTYTQECVTLWRRYGEQVAVYASCVGRVIFTPPITRSDAGQTLTMY